MIKLQEAFSKTSAAEDSAELRGFCKRLYHVAMASYYGIHFLLTWNCRHLANANKVLHLQVVNAELGLSVPVITTPDLLLMEVDDDQG